MSAPNKKPTMMEVKNVLSNIIKQFEALKEHVLMIDNILINYITYKKDADEFKAWLEEKNKKEEKDVVLPDEESKKADGNMQQE